MLFGDRDLIHNNEEIGELRFSVGGVNDERNSIEFQ
jgi:hypothetical protein